MKELKLDSIFDEFKEKYKDQIENSNTISTSILKELLSDIDEYVKENDICNITDALYIFYNNINQYSHKNEFDQNINVEETILHIATYIDTWRDDVDDKIKFRELVSIEDEKEIIQFYCKQILFDKNIDDLLNYKITYSDFGRYWIRKYCMNAEWSAIL